MSGLQPLKRPVVILHLTDLHFGYDEQDGKAARMNRLASLIKALVAIPREEPTWAPTVVAVTGDIGWSGIAQDYVEAGAWLKALLDDLNLGPEKVVVCPGNHDIDRNLSSRIARPANAQQADDFLSFPPHELNCNAFREYSKFCGSFGIPAYRLKEHVSYLVGHREVEGVRFIALNTAWYCQGQTDRGQLWVGLPLVEELISEQALCSRAEAKNVNVVLWHHPSEWWSDSEQHAYGSRVSVLHRVAVHSHLTLGGHVHSRCSPPRNSLIGSAYEFVGGATYAQAHYDNSVRLLRIDSEGVSYRCVHLESDAGDTPWRLREQSDIYPWQLPQPSQKSIGKRLQASPLRAHLTRTRDNNEFLNLAGIGRKGRVRLPIQKAYFPLNARPTGAQEHGEFRRSPAQLQGVPEIPLEQIFNIGHGCRAVVVLGEPGAGKSSFASRMAWEFATRCLDPHASGRPASVTALSLSDSTAHRPVLLKLNELDLSELKQTNNKVAQRKVRDALRRHLVRIIEPQFNEGLAKSPAELLGPGPVLWIFDGLDEVLDLKHRRLVKLAIEHMVQTPRSPADPPDWFLVTSRRQGYSGGIRFGAMFYEVELDTLSFERAYDFIRQWFPLAEGTFSFGNLEQIQDAVRKADTLIVKLSRQQQQYEQHKRDVGPWVSAGILEMLENPLLLTILCLVYDDNETLPENRVDLYGKAVELMLNRKRPNEEGVDDLLRQSRNRRKSSPDAPNQKVAYNVKASIAALAELAWWLQQQSMRVVGPRSKLAEVAGGVLANLNEPNIERDGIKFLECMRHEVGLLAVGGNRAALELGFIHRTFQEYLASVAAVSKGESRKLARHAGHDWWKEVVALSLRSSTDFNSQFFREFLAQRIINRNPNLAAYYLSEASEFPTKVIDKYLVQQLGKGKTGAEAAVEVLQWLEGSPFDNPNAIPVLAQLANGPDGLLREVAERILQRGQPDPGGSTKARRTRPLGGSKFAKSPEAVQSSPHLTGERFEDPATRLSLIWIEPGSFTMGFSNGYSEERPQHRVTLTEGFWLGEFPVTNEQYALFLREVHAREPGQWKINRCNQPQQPVVGVTWLDAMAYCAWVSQKIGAHCRLPSEAQWEFACRAGSETEYCCGNAPSQLEEYAWFLKNSGESTQPVGRKRPNDWGLFDMHGNVWEWCYDVFDPSIYKTRKDGAVDPVNAPPNTESHTSALRGLRGGSWCNSAADCRSAIRSRNKAVNAYTSVGFRVALLPGPEVKTNRTL
jgi:formylglycine-generating enzyme required for sulfatase activity